MLDLDWMESVKARLKRKNQVLFSPKDDLLAPLALLLEGQDRRAVVLWAFALVEETVERLEQKYPGEDRPQDQPGAVPALGGGNGKDAPGRRRLSWPATPWPGSGTARKISPCAMPWARGAAWYTPRATPWAIPFMS